MNQDTISSKKAGIWERLVGSLPSVFRRSSGRRSLPLFPKIVFLLVVAAVVLGEFLVPHDPLEPNPANILQSPNTVHWLGTDGFGMDVFSRVIVAARLDVGIAIAGVTIGALLGSMVGAYVAYVGGWLDTAVQKAVEVLQSFPLLLFALALFAALGDSATNLVIVIASVSFPWYARVVRSVVHPLREADFVKALENAGAGRARIVALELVPNARSQILGLFALSTALAIQTIAALAFIGLGVDPPNPEWGSMINSGAPYLLQGAWWISVSAGGALVVVVMALHSTSRFFDFESSGGI